jgi:glycosyltransferase involved in cell wall biosynthesis
MNEDIYLSSKSFGANDMSRFTFDRATPPPETPTLSVICINKNHEEYIEDTILSVLSQKFDDFEFIISDGGSTDSSLEIIGEHKFIRLLSGADSSREEGLIQALAAARGRYIMVTTSTDGYLSRDWFKTATTMLDNTPLVSMVFGASAAMSAEGSLGGVTFPRQFPFNDVPLMEKYAETWFFKGIRGAYMPELNYCVRMNVFRALVGASVDFPELNPFDPLMRFYFEFNRLGYLSYYLPVLANFGRTHPNQAQFTERTNQCMFVYETAWNRYREDVLAGRRQHVFRNGAGQVFATVSMSPPPS